MPARVLRLVCLLACLAITLPVLAQEGHPLKGSWLGDWGATRDRRNPVVLVLDWDGKNVTGTINPGPEAVALTKASLEPKGWVVHLEADGKDRSGKAVHYVIDGKIENLGLYNRSIVGTWAQDTTKGDFKLTRQ